MTELVAYKATRAPFVCYGRKEFFVFDAPKPFKSWDEQIKILSGRNVDCGSLNAAKNILSNYSYYALVNGYKSLFLKSKDPESYWPQTSLETFYALYLVDSTIKTNVLQLILLVEKAFKTKFSYVIAEDFGVIYSENLNEPKDNFLFKEHYASRRSERSAILEQILQKINSARKDSSITYYKNKHGHVPPWILVENLTLGLTIKWYALLKPDQKNKLAQMFFPEPNLALEQKKELLITTLNALREFRNILAHGNRLAFTTIRGEVRTDLLSVILPSTVLTEKDVSKNQHKKDLFACILGAAVLLRDQTAFWLCLSTLNECTKIDESGSVSVQHFVRTMYGLPNNYIERLEQLNEMCDIHKRVF